MMDIRPILSNTFSAVAATGVGGLGNRYPFPIGVRTLGATAIGGVVVGGAESVARRLINVPESRNQPQIGHSSAAQILGWAAEKIVRNSASAFVGAVLLGTLGVGGLPAASTFAVVAAYGSVVDAVFGLVFDYVFPQNRGVQRNYA